MLRLVVGVCAFVVPAAAGAQEKQPVIEEAVLRKAVTRAFPVIQRSQQVFYQKESCFSCHHHILPALLLPMARDRGVDFDAALAGEAAGKTFSYLKDLDALVQGYNFID